MLNSNLKAGALCSIHQGREMALLGLLLAAKASSVCGKSEMLQVTSVSPTYIKKMPHQLIDFVFKRYNTERTLKHLLL